MVLAVLERVLAKLVLSPALMLWLGFSAVQKSSLANAAAETCPSSASSTRAAGTRLFFLAPLRLLVLIPKSLATSSPRSATSLASSSSDERWKATGDGGAFCV
jgi:hypothetical protein